MNSLLRYGISLKISIPNFSEINIKVSIDLLLYHVDLWYVSTVVWPNSERLMTVQ